MQYCLVPKSRDTAYYGGSIMKGLYYYRLISKLCWKTSWGQREWHYIRDGFVAGDLQNRHREKPAKAFHYIMTVTRVRSGRSDPPAFGNNLIRHLLKIKDLWFYPTPDKIISESPDLPVAEIQPRRYFILITTRVRPFQHNIRVYYALCIMTFYAFGMLTWFNNAICKMLLAIKRPYDCVYRTYGRRVLRTLSVGMSDDWQLPRAVFNLSGWCLD